MALNLLDVSKQCEAWGGITSVYMIDADAATLPEHWLSGYADGNISGASAVSVGHMAGSPEITVRESPDISGRSHTTELRLVVSRGQQDVDELAARHFHAMQVHVLFTDRHGIVRVLEYARGRADFSVAARLGDAQKYEISFTAIDVAPPRIYAGTIP